jgi:hypothetical protein
MALKLIFVILAAACWGVMSKYLFHGIAVRPYSFWGKESWRRKYKRYINVEHMKTYTLINAPDTPYYRFFKLKYKEAFPWSATLLVFVTDGFHLTQWFMIKFVIAAITLDWRWYLVYWITWTVGFTITYTWLKWRE